MSLYLKLLIIISFFLSKTITFNLKSNKINNLIRNNHIKLSYNGLNTIEETNDDLLKKDIRKWYLTNGLNINQYEIILSQSKYLYEIYSDIWKATTISNKIIDSNRFNEDNVLVYVFPLIKSNNNNKQIIIQSYNEIVNRLLNHFIDSSPLFPYYKHYYEFNWKPISDNENILILTIKTRMNDSGEYSLINWDKEIDNIYNNLNSKSTSNIISNLYNNDIKTFPFPTIYDFISEINRPIDLQNKIINKYNYNIKDLKYDLKKMSKKRNPQEFVDIINCRLTRLDYWKNILLDSSNNNNEIFTNDNKFINDIKLKYYSMKLLNKINIKNTLDTQYDKKKVFINIIDQWSDRLKRHFLFTYKSTGKKIENFNEKFENSNLNNYLKKLNSFFIYIPFLNFSVVDRFNLTKPLDIFNKNRKILYEKEYSIDIVLYELLLFQQRINYISNYSSNQLIYQPAQLYSFSSSDTTESVLYDTWSSISNWLNNNYTSNLLDLTTINKNINNLITRNTNNHTSSYLSTLRQVNTFTRKESFQSGRSVKELYKHWFEDGLSGIKWFIKLVRDLDMFTEVENIVTSYLFKWNNIINSFMVNRLKINLSIDSAIDWFDSHSNATKNEIKQIDRLLDINSYNNKEYENPSKSINISDTITSYNHYRYLFKRFDYIDSLFPKPINYNIYTDEKQLYNENIIESLNSRIYNNNQYQYIHDNDLYIIPCKYDDIARSEDLVIVYPRYFRGIGMEEELSAFLELSKIVEKDLQLLDIKTKVIALHPQMIDFETGEYDYAKRSPHPALIITKNI